MLRRSGKKFSESFGGNGGGGGFEFKNIFVPSDFPTIAEADANLNWVYVGRGDPSVIDNDPTKTNTGQALELNTRYNWDVSRQRYYALGADDIWLDDGIEVKTHQPREINQQNKPIKNISETLTNILTLAGVSVDEITTIVDGSSTDSQLATAKAIEDKFNASKGEIDIIPVDNDEQTFFPNVLSREPTSKDTMLAFIRGQFFDYNYGFTVSGKDLTWLNPDGFKLQAENIATGQTEDRFIILYDYAFNTGGLDQKQIYYVGDAGNDSNDGKSMETPFETPTAAAAAIVAQTPSAFNRFEIKMIGSMEFTGNLTIPDFTTISSTGKTAILGNVTLGIAASIDGVIISGGIIKATSGISYVNVSALGHSGVVVTQSEGELYLTADKVIHSGSAPLIIKTGASSILHYDVKKTESSGTTDTFNLDDAGKTYFNVDSVKKSGVGGAIFVVTGAQTVFCDAPEIDAGTNDWLLIIESSKFYCRAGKITGTVTDDNSNEIKIDMLNKPAFSAYNANPINNVTGDGTVYDLILPLEDFDIAGNYDHSTGIFTVPYTGIYQFDSSIGLDNITGSHTVGQAQLHVTGAAAQDWISFKENPASTTAIGGTLYRSGITPLVKLTKGDLVNVQIRVSNSSKTINILPGSKISGRLVQTL